MKSRVVAVAIVAFAFAGTLMRSDIPKNRSSSPKEGSSFSLSEESVSEDPPSNTAIAAQIKLQKAVEDFKMDGWSISFEVMSAVQKKKANSVLYRAIAVRSGSPRYAYWVYKLEVFTPIHAVSIGVEAPLPIAACPDGSDLNDMNCGGQ